MPFEIGFDAAAGIIRVRYQGDVDLNQRLAVVEEVCRSIDREHAARILVDVREMNLRMTIDEQRSFGEYLADRTELKRAKLAILHQKSHNPNIIVDSCAVVNGLRLAQFDLSRDAMSWLTGLIR